MTMAKEYIERKRAIVDACNSLELYPSEYAKLEDALNRIPAADVMEVVRCCNCEFHDHDGTSGYCNYWRRWSNMSDFCSRGK